MRKKKVLVTGANGFVGTRLVKRLTDLNYTIYKIVNHKNKDLFNKKTYDKFPEVNTIIHLAAKTFAPDSWQNPEEFLKINLLGTVRILEFAKTLKVKPLVIFAGSFVYGNVNKVPISENHKSHAANPYMLSKIMAEEVCRFYSQNFDIPCVSLRVFNIYGPNQSRNFLIPSIIKGLKSKNLNLENPKPRRDLIFIDDVIEAYIKAMRHKKGFEVINIASGKSYSVDEIAQKLKNISKSKAKIIYKNIQRVNEIMDTRADIKKAKKILNWEPKVNIDEGLKKTWNASAKA